MSEIVAQVSLRGSSLTLQGEIHTPELNGQGAYAKAWKRENNSLYLHKVGANGRELESRIEVMVSDILDKCSVDHVKYENSNAYGVYTCRCECMTTEDKSILNGMDFISYCNVNGLNPDKTMMEIDSENIYKMWIVDYLISNRDRHGMNWGFYYDSSSMEILGCHPLFDHNNAFDEPLMADKNARYLFNQNMSMREAALKAMHNVDFYFTQKILPTDFLNPLQYESFMDRAEELRIPIREKPLLLTDIMENKWNDFVAKSKEDKRSGIEWNGEKIRLAVFDDIYLAECQKNSITPNDKIKEHFWNNCVKIQGYMPQFVKSTNELIK